MKHKLLLALFLFFIGSASANNMLVQNVITLVDNPVDRTIQIQLDMSWDNSWRDATNYDAAWVFVKFKDASGLWQHAKLNQTGFITGSGTPDSVKVSADSVGAWVYRSGLGSGTLQLPECSCSGIMVLVDLLL
ncbi:MAG: hypothetical protein IPN61_02165 [Bacteroidetes bacterium]|nr:hypothetical protein [Bacteroidota bacterium]